MRVVRAAMAAIACVLVAASAARLLGQQPPSAPLRLLAASGTRALPTVVTGDVELIALEDLAAIFQVAVREDTATGTLIVTAQGRTAVLTPGQSIASVSGRLISLPAPPVRIRDRWHVPVEFLGRALGPLLQTRFEVRRGSRLVIAGDLRVPRVTLRYDHAAGHPRLTFDIAPQTPRTVSQQPSQLLVRFDAAALDFSTAAFTPDQAVTAIRVIEPATVAIDLGPRFGSFRATDVAGDAATGRFVLDIFLASQTTGPAQPGPTEPGPPAEPVPALPAPVLARTIVIDPGHGGEDDGARGAKGAREKDVVLAIARRVKAGIEARLGGRVLLTREDDRSVPLDQRAALANNNKADLFISLHANAALHPDASGAEVYVLRLREGDVPQPPGGGPVAMPVFGGGTRQIDIVPWALAQARHVDASRAFGTIVLAQLRESLAVSPRGLTAAPMRVLAGVNMPAVLVEVGYLSTAAQEQQLTSGEFQGRVAGALVDAIARHHAAAPPRPPAAPAIGARP